MIGPLEENEQFLMEDFGLLEKYVSKLSVSAIQKKIAALELGFDKYDISCTCFNVMLSLISVAFHYIINNLAVYSFISHVIWCYGITAICYIV